MKFKINIMGKKKQYSDDVYKRLELVEKQFQANAARQKKEMSAERRQRALNYLERNKTYLLRRTLYVLMALLVIAVIVTLVVM